MKDTCFGYAVNIRRIASDLLPKINANSTLSALPVRRVRAHIYS